MIIQSLFLTGISSAQIDSLSIVNADFESTDKLESEPDFTAFLLTLNDTLVAQFKDIESRLDSAELLIDHNEKQTGQLIQKISRTADSSQILTVLLPYAENFGFLKQEISALRKAMVNVSSSPNVEYELSYIIESEEFFQSELANLTFPDVMVDGKMYKSSKYETASIIKEQKSSMGQPAILPSFDCNLIIEENENNLSKKSTPQWTLFQFKPQKLSEHFVDLDQIDAKAQITQVKEKYFLELEIILHTAHAKDTYGGIEKGASLRMVLDSEEEIVVQNLKRNFGSFDESTNRMTFQAIYPISQKNAENLESDSLKNMGLVWTTGYENYAIEDTSFFINNLPCFR